MMCLCTESNGIRYCNRKLKQLSKHNLIYRDVNCEAMMIQVTDKAMPNLDQMMKEV